MVLDMIMISVIIISLLIILLGSTVWIGVSLFLIGLICLTYFTGYPPMQILSNIIWEESNSFTLMALPLFIFMGEILFRSKIAENLFKGITPWITFIPGSLIHVNVISSGLFASVSGSSAATTATVGRITIPELKKRNYDRSLSLGTLAGAGTLGFLIPPSMMMIVYGIAANESIGQLFIAGIIPGILLIIGLMGYTIVRCLINPELAPKIKGYTWSDRFKALPLLLPVILLIAIVLGSIYMGWATPTESAAIGVIGAVILAGFSRSLSVKVLRDAIMGSVKTNAMIMLILLSASYLSVVVGYLGIPYKLTEFISTLNLSKYGIIIVIAVVYIFLGTILEGFSMIVMSLPLALPLITAAGFDTLWFGIFLILMIEIAQITPPVGINLFVISGLTKEDILKIAIYAVPSFLIILTLATAIVLFPQIVTWLPNLMVK